ncbi:hypothetical protein [Leptospira andrefontaineae]|uniref:Uncharacterized protein n=1 Tax=Leptospira andrefontaineae TaxID=2484976 RepID=A0A4R9HBX1_9LEPT|nr:hypothetical protein [Leptospira andrefontaineae]TGK43912.1 hypothetical protein EHO65_04540 [Leptospira andrefontaineae]
MKASINAILIVGLLTCVSFNCLYYHTLDPVLSRNNVEPSSCLSVVAFKTLINGLPPDINTEQSADGKRTNIKVTEDKYNGQSHPVLDVMAKEVFNESGILSSNDKQGTEVQKGVFIQINNKISYSALGYAGRLLSTMTLSILPSRLTALESFDVSAFEDQKLLFRKTYLHEVRSWLWLPLVFFFWAGDDQKEGQYYYRDVVKDVISNIIAKRKELKKCTK